MLEGNVRAAVHWLMELCGGGVSVKPSDSTTIGETSMTVLEALSLKYPDPCVPPHWILPSRNNLPLCEYSEITGSIFYQLHIIYKEGYAGTGGCDASHWRGILLRYSVLFLEYLFAQFYCRIMLLSLQFHCSLGQNQSFSC